MFDLVADVEHYPEFVPLCQTLSVRKRSVDPHGRDVLLCDMLVGYKAIRERLVSTATLDREKNKILVRYVEGPFSHLENVWSFVPEGPDENAPNCRVEFFIDYTFSSRVLAALMGAMFDAAFPSFRMRSWRERTLCTASAASQRRFRPGKPERRGPLHGAKSTPS